MNSAREFFDDLAFTGHDQPQGALRLPVEQNDALDRDQRLLAGAGDVADPALARGWSGLGDSQGIVPQRFGSQDCFLALIDLPVETRQRLLEDLVVKLVAKREGAGCIDLDQRRQLMQVLVELRHVAIADLRLEGRDQNEGRDGERNQDADDGAEQQSQA